MRRKYVIELSSLWSHLYSYSKSHVSVSIANKSFYRFITVIKHPKDGNVPPTHFLVHLLHGVINIATFALLNLNHQKIGMSNTNTSSQALALYLTEIGKTSSSAECTPVPSPQKRQVRLPQGATDQPFLFRAPPTGTKARLFTKNRRHSVDRWWCGYIVPSSFWEESNLMSLCSPNVLGNPRNVISLRYLKTYVSLDGTHFSYEWFMRYIPKTRYSWLSGRSIQFGL